MEPTISNPGPTRHLKVLYFIGSYSPNLMGNVGHEQAILAMKARGHAVDVLTQINNASTPAYSVIEYSGVKVHRINIARKRGSGAVARRLSGRLLQYEHIGALIRGYRRTLAATKYDLVHVESVYPFGFVASVSGGATPYIVNVQGAEVIELPDNDYGYRRFRIVRPLVSFALRRAALIRVNSPFMVGYLAGQNLARPNRLVVVPRVLEESAFPPPGSNLKRFKSESRAWLAEKYGLGESRPIVMSLSRLHPFKGLEYLVDAIPQVAHEAKLLGSPVPWFVFCGPSRATEKYGDYREFLRRRAEHLGHGSDLVFTGQVEHDEVRRHLAGADIVACPSIIEALHRVALEAAAVGTPAVITNTTGAASYLAPEGACVEVPPRSAEGLASGIARLLEDGALSTDIQQSALRVAESMRVEKIAPQLETAWIRAAGL